MEVAKTVIVHLIIGAIITFLSIFFMQICGGVGIADGSVNKPIICVKI